MDSWFSLDSNGSGRYLQFMKIYHTEKYIIARHEIHVLELLNTHSFYALSGHSPYEILKDLGFETKKVTLIGTVVIAYERIMLLTFNAPLCILECHVFTFRA